MSIELGSMPIVAIEELPVQFLPLQETQARKRRRPLAIAMAGAFAALLVSGCSSNNPDALTGTNVEQNAATADANAGPGANVDENLAMMDANTSSGANVASLNAASTNGSNTNGPNANAGSPNSATHGSHRSGDTTLAKANARRSSDNQGRSAEVNASATDAHTSLNEDESDANEVPNTEEQPNVI